jgi:hypothetical protein
VAVTEILWNVLRLSFSLVVNNAGGVHTNLLSDEEICKNFYGKIHALLRDVNKHLPGLSTFAVRYGCKSI